MAYTGANKKPPNEEFRGTRGLTKALHFLDLPPAIRERIYKTACRRPASGPYSQDLIALEGHEDPHTRWHAKHYTVGRFQAAASLLLTCRRIHDEVFRVVYSQNDFLVRQSVPGGLDVLYNLRPENLGSLSCLTVCLDVNNSVTQTLCSYPGWAISNCSYHSEGKLPTLQEANVRIWHRALTHILPYLPRSNFCLKLICEFECLKVDVARKIAPTLLSPLDGLPLHWGCSVKLGISPSMELRSLATEIAMRAMNRPPAERPFRLLDLPPEVRSRILSYTDLITKRREVEWRPGRGYWTSGKNTCVDNWEDQPGGNYCRRTHAAFTPSCKCWISPLPLFLTCRILRFEAERVFFQHNRIVIKPASGVNNVVPHTPAVLEASYYLRHVIPPHALRYLRFLEIVFPPFDGAYLPIHEYAYRDWLSVLDFVKDKLHYPKLFLRVVFSGHAEWHYSYSPWRCTLPTEERAEEIFESYKRTLYPLSVLRTHGLHSLNIDLISPYWLHEGLHSYANQRQNWKQSMALVEKDIWTQVMGKDHINYMPNPGHSLWKRAWNNMVYHDGCSVDYDDPTMTIVLH